MDYLKKYEKDRKALNEIQTWATECLKTLERESNNAEIAKNLHKFFENYNITEKLQNVDASISEEEGTKSTVYFDAYDFCESECYLAFQTESYSVLVDIGMSCTIFRSSESCELRYRIIIEQFNRFKITVCGSDSDWSGRHPPCKTLELLRDNVTFTDIKVGFLLASSVLEVVDTPEQIRNCVKIPALYHAYEIESWEEIPSLNTYITQQESYGTKRWKELIKARRTMRFRTLL